MKKIVACSISLSLMAINNAQAQVDFNLMNAVKDNNITKTEKYINPLNVNVRDYKGNTALSYAVKNQNFEITQLLLANGANPALMDSSKDYIFCRGLLSPNIEMRYLFSNYNYNSCNLTPNSFNAESTSASISSGSFFNWTAIGGTVAIVGGGVAIAIGGGGGSGSNEESGNLDALSYSNVGQVDEFALNSILNNDQYNGSWNVSGVLYSNASSFDAIRMAYSFARDYTGKVESNPETPSFLPNPSSDVADVSGKIRIAIVDTGVLTNHEDLDANIINSNLNNTNKSAIYCNASGLCSDEGTFDNPDPIANPDTSGSDNSYHGTAVAGLAGAVYNSVGIVGVASDAEIIPYRVTIKTSEFIPNYYIGEAFEDAGNSGVKVVNNSYGASAGGIADNKVNASSFLDPSLSIAQQQQLVKSLLGDVDEGSYYRDTDFTTDSTTASYDSNFINQMIAGVENHDMVFVFAAGNDGYAESSIQAGLPLYFSELEGNFINVVNYDAANNTLYTGDGVDDLGSNHCGVTAQYCLTAPGTDLISTGFNGDASNTGFYLKATGTSLSAPLVSGAVAVLKGAFPYLTGDEITKLLFETARDLGVEGVDEVYGHGMLDLERATRPVGANIVPIDNNIAGSGFSLASSTLKLNSMMAENIKEKNLKFVMLDGYNRAYKLSLNDYITTEVDHINMKDTLRKFGNKITKKTKLSDDDTLNFYYTTSYNPVDPNPHSEARFSYTDKQYNFNMYYGNDPYNGFVSEKNEFYNNFTLADAYGYNALNPYFSINSEENFGMNTSFRLNERLRFNVGFLYQNYVMDFDEYDQFSEDEKLGTGMAFIGGFDYDIDKNLTTTFEFGVINEDETLFGTAWDGAFGIGENNSTYMFSVQTDAKFFDDKLSFIGRVNFGFTNANDAENSLVKDISSLYSQSYAVGVSYDFSKEKNNKSSLAFLVSQPLKIQSGDFELSLPSSRDDIGNIYYENHDVDLGSRQETNFQLTYNHEINSSTSFNVGAMYRDYVDDEFIVMFKLSKLLGNID